MVIFNSYVKLPEGIPYPITVPASKNPITESLKSHGYTQLLVPLNPLTRPGYD